MTIETKPEIAASCLNQQQTIDSTCRDVVKTLNKTVSDQRNKLDETIKDIQDLDDKINFIGDLYKELLSKSSSPEQDKLFDALLKAKVALGTNIEKTSSGNWGSYANFPDLVYYAKPILAKFGIDIILEPIVILDHDCLKATISHTSGQWRSSISAIRPDYKPAQDPNQSYGSALTYMKKYVYASLLNLQSTDK
jgi:hypothetical protein